MLPPEFTGFRFHADAAGEDAQLAARVKAATLGQRVLVLGCERVGLLRALGEHGLGVTVVDPSRSALERVRSELPAEGAFTLLAEDPREMSVPGGADLALLPSIVWRAVILADDRVSVLRSLRHVVGRTGALALDVERLPIPMPQADAPGRLTGDGRPSATWWHRGRGFDLVTVRLGDEEQPGPQLDLAAFSPARCRMELTRAGFTRQHVTDAATAGEETATSRRLWIVARVEDGRHP